MLINICNRTKVQKCTVFKIKKILYSLKNTAWLFCGKVKHELRVQIRELRVPIHELRVQIHELRVQIHELEDEKHELQD